MRYMVIVLLAGCASVSNVAPYGNDTYIVSASDPGGTTGRDDLHVKVVEQANIHCSKLSKKMVVKDAQVSGNRWAGTGATLVFSCQ
jgi:hypothetical protein